MKAQIPSSEKRQAETLVKKGEIVILTNIYRWGGNSTPLMNSYLPKFKFFRYFFTNSAKTFFLTTA